MLAQQPRSSILKLMTMHAGDIRSLEQKLRGLFRKISRIKVHLFKIKHVLIFFIIFYYPNLCSFVIKNFYILKQ